MAARVKRAEVAAALVDMARAQAASGQASAQFLAGTGSGEVVEETTAAWMRSVFTLVALLFPDPISSGWHSGQGSALVDDLVVAVSDGAQMARQRLAAA